MIERLISEEILLSYNEAAVTQIVAVNEPSWVCNIKLLDGRKADGTCRLVRTIAKLQDGRITILDCPLSLIS